MPGVGARPENLKQLQQDYSQLKVIKLEQNYRSTMLFYKLQIILFPIILT